MTAALEGGEWSAARGGRTLSPVPILQEAGWTPGPVWTGGKSRPTGIRSPVLPARSQSLYRLSYPAHTTSQYSILKAVHYWNGKLEETFIEVGPVSVIIHRLTAKIFCSLPLTPQPTSRTNRELYSSRLDRHSQEIQT